MHSIKSSRIPQNSTNFTKPCNLVRDQDVDGSNRFSPSFVMPRFQLLTKQFCDTERIARLQECESPQHLKRRHLELYTSTTEHALSVGNCWNFRTLVQPTRLR